MIDPQLESITIRYGKRLSKNYNSVEFMIEETYLVPHISEFNRKDFIKMKATEFENIIDEKIQSDSTETETPSTEEKASSEKAVGHCMVCNKELDQEWMTYCPKHYAIKKKQEKD